MIEYCIRLSDIEEMFIYSLRRGGVVLDTEEVCVRPVVAEADAECKYYGGSQAVD